MEIDFPYSSSAFISYLWNIVKCEYTCSSYGCSNPVARNLLLNLSRLSSLAFCCSTNDTGIPKTSDTCFVLSVSHSSSLLQQYVYNSHIGVLSLMKGHQETFVVG